MSRIIFRLGLAGMAFATYVMSSGNAVSQTTEIERGKYLVTLGGCNDCLSVPKTKFDNNAGGGHPRPAPMRCDLRAG